VGAGDGAGVPAPPARLAVTRLHVIAPITQAADVARHHDTPKANVVDQPDGSRTWHFSVGGVPDPLVTGCTHLMSTCTCVNGIRPRVWTSTHSVYYLTAADLQRINVGETLYVIAHEFAGEGGTLPGLAAEYRWTRHLGRIVMEPNGPGGTVYEHADLTHELRAGALQVTGVPFRALYGGVKVSFGSTSVYRFVMYDRPLPIAHAPLAVTQHVVVGGRAVDLMGPLIRHLQSSLAYTGPNASVAREVQNAVRTTLRSVPGATMEAVTAILPVAYRQVRGAQVRTVGQIDRDLPRRLAMEVVLSRTGYLTTWMVVPEVAVAAVACGLAFVAARCKWRKTTVAAKVVLPAYGLVTAARLLRAAMRDFTYYRTLLQTEVG